MSLTKFDQARLDGYQGTLTEYASKAFRDGGILAARSVGFDGAEADLVALVASEDAIVERRIRDEQAHADQRAEIVRSIMADADFVSAITGADGLDAYQLAQSKGYDGELQDWLASLSGVDGSSAYEIALQRGYDGTEDEWLKALVGLDGMSAYDLWVSVGNNGSMAEFLASLKGEKGDKGDQGEQGERGEQGEQGETGPAPKHQWDGTRLRFERPDGTWGAWVDLKGAMGAAGSGGGGSLSLHKFYASVAGFPAAGSAQILYFDTSSDPYGVYVWHDGAYKQVGGGEGGAVAPTNEPMGFENRTDSTISATTTDFTISGTYSVWVKGVKYQKTVPESVTIPEGLSYVSFIEGGVLQTSPTYFNFSQAAPVAIIYKNGSQVRLHEERHGIVMDWATHQYLHLTRGAAYSSGFDIGDFVTGGNGSLDAHAQFGLSGGVFFDEDIRVGISSGALGNFIQPLNGIAQLPVAYKVGSAWVFDTPTQFAIKTGANGRMTYNQNTGGSYSVTELANNRYGVMFIVATNSPTNPVISIMGQAQYGEAAAADASFYSDLDLDGFPTQEFRPLFKIVFRTANSYTNAVKSTIETVTDIRAIETSGFGVTAVPYEQSVRKSFETVSKNLDSVGATLNYTAGELTSVVYANGVTKTLSYTAGELITITLSGATPDGIALTKTLTYTAGELTSVAYS
jgi:hypothetical protein